MYKIGIKENGEEHIYEIDAELCVITDMLIENHDLYFVTSEHFIVRLALKKNNTWIIVCFDKFSWDTLMFDPISGQEISEGGYSLETVNQLLDKLNTLEFNDKGNEGAFQQWLIRNGWELKKCPIPVRLFVF